MKSFILACVSLFVGLSSADTVLYPRGCIYIIGRCAEECPVGTHAYALGCGHKTPEPTCAQPHPVQERGTLCDYSACYCDPPTVRDEKTNKCVLMEECSPQDVPTVTLLPPLEDPKPVSTEAPVTPIKPDAPVTPINPDASAAPDAHAKPDAPAASEAYANSDAPAAPEAYAKPDAPAAPEATAKPDAPAAPETTAQPDAPAAPEAPTKPDTPVAVKETKEPAPVVEASPTTDKPEEKKE